MDLKGLVNKAEGLKNVAADAAGKLLDDLNEAIPTIHGLGLDVRDLHLEMGVPPEITAKLVGAVESIDVAKIKDLAANNTEKRLLVTLLKTLETAYNIKDQLKDLHFKGVEIDLKLGLSPKVNVGFLN